MKTSRTLVNLLALALAALLGAFAVACTTGQKKDVANSAFDAMSEKEKMETFEAMARVLDENPGLVDRMYAAVRLHKPMMNRFLDNTAADLKTDPDLAWRVSTRIVADKPSLIMTLRTTTDVVAKDPGARQAMNKAISDRAETMVDILTDDDETLGRMIEVSLRVLAKKPKARQRVLTAVSEHRGQILSYVKQDKQLAKAMTKEFLSEAVEDKPLLQKVLRSLDVAE
jgi:hypothetical protein